MMIEGPAFSRETPVIVAERMGSLPEAPTGANYWTIVIDCRDGGQEAIADYCLN